MDKDGYLDGSISKTYFANLVTGTKGRMMPRDEMIAAVSARLEEIFNSVEDDKTDNNEVRE